MIVLKEEMYTPRSLNQEVQCTIESQSWEEQGQLRVEGRKKHVSEAFLGSPWHRRGQAELVP